MQALRPGKVELREGWYCPELGRRIAAPVVQWTATVRLPAVCGWVFQWPDTMGDVSLDGNVPAEAILSWCRPGESLQFRPAGGLPSSGGAARREAAD